MRRYGCTIVLFLGLMWIGGCATACYVPQLIFPPFGAMQWHTEHGLVRFHHYVDHSSFSGENAKVIEFFRSLNRVEHSFESNHAGYDVVEAWVTPDGKAVRFIWAYNGHARNVAFNQGPLLNLVTGGISDEYPDGSTEILRDQLQLDGYRMLTSEAVPFLSSLYVRYAFRSALPWSIVLLIAFMVSRYIYHRWLGRERPLERSV